MADKNRAFIMTERSGSDLIVGSHFDIILTPREDIAKKLFEGAKALFKKFNYITDEDEVVNSPDPALNSKIIGFLIGPGGFEIEIEYTLDREIQSSGITSSDLVAIMELRELITKSGVLISDSYMISISRITYFGFNETTIGLGIDEETY